MHNASPSVCDCAGADFLRGVEVYRETVLEVVGDKPQKVEWPGYGFFIEVPEGAVPPGVTASVGVKVILAGQFKFPENSQLISAIYWVLSSVEFVKKLLSIYSIVQSSAVRINAPSTSSSSPSAHRKSFRTNSVNERDCSAHTLNMEPSS